MFHFQSFNNTVDVSRSLYLAEISGPELNMQREFASFESRPIGAAVDTAESPNGEDCHPGMVLVYCGVLHAVCPFFVLESRSLGH